MTNTDLLILYKKYSIDLITILINELRKVKKNSSGKLINSLSSDIKPLADDLNVIINGEDYFDNVDKGRKKGSYVPIKNLERWCTLKNIPKSAAFAISKNIYKFGIKPTNVLNKAMTKWYKDVIPDIEKDTAKKIEQEIIQKINKL